MPGGLGTFEELFEVLTWAQLGIHKKPCGLLNSAGYYFPLIGFLRRATDDGFVAPEHKDLVLVVEDNGPGIDEKQRANLGEPFYRGDPSRTRETGGTGLGLYLTKLAAEAHGGNLSVDAGYTSGARFVVRLPG